ncbi:MAG TPA: PAS domain-containing protein [Candidatus Limnocylindrales bacterium]
MTLAEADPGVTEALLFRLALDASPVGVAIVDRELRYVYVNEALARINGIAAADHVGRPVSEVVPDVDQAAVRSMGRVLAGGPAVRDMVVTGATAAEAEGVWLESFEPLAAEGRIVALLAVVQDVTVVRRTQEALERERLGASVLAQISRDVLEHVRPEEIAGVVLPDTLAAIGATWGTLHVLDEASQRLQLLGASGVPEAAVADLGSLPLAARYALSEVARTAETLVVRSRRQLARFAPDAPIKRLVGDGEAALVPLRVPHLAVGVLALGFEAGHLSDERLVAARMLANIASSSIARARAHLAERSAREVLEAVIEQMPLGVAVTDERGGVVSTNSALRRIWGGERRSRSVEEYGLWHGFHPDGRPYADEEWPLARSIRGGEVVVAEEIAIERFDGTRGTIALSSAPVRAADGSAVAAVAVVADVTERRQAEAAREAFLGVLAHELRTPLTSIAGGARLLARQSLDAAVREELRADVESEAERMARVVENLLVLSRVERGLGMAVHDPVLVQRIVGAIVAAEQRIWPGVVFQVDVEPSLPVVRGDDELLGQVLRNLLSNAAKYGGGHVTIGARRDGDEVVLVVADDGPGIDPADRERVFDLFYRSPRIHGRAPGAGIGLFVVRRLVEAMGGEVELASAGGGAAFTIRLAPFEMEPTEETPGR